VVRKIKTYSRLPSEDQFQIYYWINEGDLKTRMIMYKNKEQKAVLVLNEEEELLIVLDEWTNSNKSFDDLDIESVESDLDLIN
jgi:hypothetical protein